MDDLKARSTRARHSVALSYAALQAPLTDDTCVTRTELQNAVSDMLEAVADELHILLSVRDVVLTLSAPTDDEVEDTVPLHDERSADELRQALLARAARRWSIARVGSRARSAMSGREALMLRFATIGVDQGGSGAARKADVRPTLCGVAGLQRWADLGIHRERQGRCRRPGSRRHPFDPHHARGITADRTSTSGPDHAAIAIPCRAPRVPRRLCTRREAALGAVIYCRVSTKEQTQNLSIPTQRKACRDYCARHGLVVAEEFIEAGESAKTADRTQLTALLAYCREHKGKVHALVVYNLSRFARDRYDHVVIRAQLHRMGVTLRSVMEPIDDSPVGKLMEGVVSAIAQFDNDQKAERTAAGMQEALKLGRWTFKGPLGYVNARSKTVRACFRTWSGRT